MSYYSKSILGDLLTPVSAFLRIAAGEERAFLLESVEGAERIGRYSFIGFAPQKTFRGSYREFRRSFSEFVPPDMKLPPLCGGAVGFFTYDLVREFERIPTRNTPDHNLGPVSMDFYSTVLVFDHLKHEILIISHESQERVDEVEARLREAQIEEQRSRFTAPLLPASEINGNQEEEDEDKDFGGERFEDGVAAAQKYIREGDIFQVVLSQRFERDFRGDPFNVYRALRYLNPSPYHFFLKQGDLSLAGASPEMLIRVTGSDIECRPIAGTRRRGHTETEDLALQQELLNDEKERAEHLMLVDLGRNDLGRVSRYGLVSVEEFMRVEKYSHVMHLVSSVKGLLRPELDALDALPACFPAGTVSGAPKVRAMEIIEELEPRCRDIYAGAVGYLDYSGNLDTCIAIRTIVFRNGKAYIQAGAGVVADSIPRLENKECRNKARVLFKALEMGAGN